MWVICSYNCTFLHKNNHDSKKCELQEQLQHKSSIKLLKLMSVHQFVSILIITVLNSDVMYLHTSPAINYIQII